MHDPSGAAPDERPAPIQPARHVSARELARNTAQLLREVADAEIAFAIRHFGRVVAFLVPLEGRVATKRKGELVYEVEIQKPLMDLGPEELEVLRNLDAEGPMANPTSGRLSTSQMMALLGRMSFIDELIEQKGPYWKITQYGRRHLGG